MEFLDALGSALFVLAGFASGAVIGPAIWRGIRMAKEIIKELNDEK